MLKHRGAYLDCKYCKADPQRSVDKQVLDKAADLLDKWGHDDRPATHHDIDENKLNALINKLRGKS